MATITGQCLCGATAVHVAKEPNDVSACHCGMCRKWGGGPAMGVDCGTDVTFSGEDNIQVFVSSEWAERGFCRICGTHLFWRMRETGHCHVSAGLFGRDDQYVFDVQIFVEQKPAYYSFANETKTMTGDEVFALFAGESTQSA